MGADPTTSVVVIATEAPDQARALVDTVLSCTDGSFEVMLADSRAGWRAARGSEVCLIDGDIVLRRGWLPTLRAALHSAPDVGAVGPSSDMGEHAWHGPSPGDAPPHGRRSFAPGLWFETERLTGCAILARRAALEQIGGLDQPEGLSERLRAAGWRLLSMGEPAAERHLPQPTAHPPAPFILGAPRSGTTLLRMMLDAHPQLAIPPETHFIPELLGAWDGAEDPLGAFVETLIGHPRWHSFHLDAEELRRRLTNPRAETPGDAIRAFYTLYADGQGKPRWGDKTPPYVRAMPRIAGVLPEAHFIHVIRDGRDVAASLRRVWFGPSEIEESALLWRDRVLAARRLGQEVPRYTEVRYERLVAEPRVILRRLCVKLELPFRPVMLSYHRRAEERLREDDLSDIETTTELAEGTDRNVIHQHLLRPPDESRVGKWREELSPDEQRRFFSVAGNLLQRLGYPIA
jgi:hypothetical protein